MPRERLAGLLWGERSEKQARASLRQALYEMRALNVGDHPLLILDRAQVRLAPGRVSTDIDRFRACARAGDAPSLAALQRDLGVAPSEETGAIHRRLMALPIPRFPGRVRGDVSAVLPGMETVADPSLVPGPTAETPAVVEAPPMPIASFFARLNRHRRWATAALVFFVSAVSLALWSQRPDAAGRRRLLMVQPLHVGPGDASAVALGRGLSTELARIMVGNDATLLVADPDGPASHAAESIHPRDRFTVMGDAQSHGGMVRVSIRLFSARDDAILWSSSFDRPANEITALREQIASKLADVTICALGGRNPTLDDLGLETLALPRCLREQARRLERVCQAVGASGPAQAQLRACVGDAGRRHGDGCVAAFERGGGAVQTGPSLPAIGRWSERMAILQAGHVADPANSPVDEMLAWNLAGVGRWQEAIAYAQQAEASDPFSPGAAWMLAQLLGCGNFSHDADSMLQRAARVFRPSASRSRTSFSLPRTRAIQAMPSAFLTTRDRRCACRRNARRSGGPCSPRGSIRRPRASTRPSRR